VDRRSGAEDSARAMEFVSGLAARKAAWKPKALRALSDHPADSRQGLVNIRSVRANPETEAKPITAVIAMHVDSSKLCFDLTSARRPEGEKVAVLCIGPKWRD
jgi:hypothetical protein